MRNSILQLSAAALLASLIAAPAYAASVDEDAAAPVGSFTSNMIAPSVHVKADAVQVAQASHIRLDLAAR